MRLIHHRLDLAIVKLPPDAESPAWAGRGRFSSISRTPRELSIVCESHLVPDGSSGGWELLEVEGPLALSLVGILADLTVPLAEAGVSVFAVATHDTDYLLIRSDEMRTAIDALTGAGHEIGTAPV